MSDRKEILVILILAVGVLAPGALFALLFLDPMLSLPICAGVTIIFFTMTLRLKRHGQDRVTELQVKAAQRGDHSMFIGRSPSR